MIKDLEKELQELFNDDYSGHDYQHLERVYNNALMIMEDIECNEVIVKLAALLHDCDDRKLFDSSDYDNARRLMNNHHIDLSVQNQVIEIIKEVSFKGNSSVAPASIEGKIVQDADRLDAIGAIGIARCFMYSGAKSQKMYDFNDQPLLEMNEEEYFNHHSNAINHFYEKLLLLKDMMNTEKGKAIAIQRDAYMRAFLDEFIREVK